MQAYENSDKNVPWLEFRRWYGGWQFDTLAVERNEDMYCTLESHPIASGTSDLASQQPESAESTPGGPIFAHMLSSPRPTNATATGPGPKVSEGRPADWRKLTNASFPHV